MAITDDSVKPGDLPGIVEEAEWEEHLPALVTGVKVQGKRDGTGASNFQARVFDKRTRWLKELFENFQRINGTGVILKGVLYTEQALAAIPTDDLLIGTAYFLNFELRMWNGKEWASSGSLRGDRGINILGVWPDEVELPDYKQRQMGDAYIYKHDIWVLVPDFDYYDTNPDPNAPPVWEELGIRGPAGASTYETWKEQPGNKDKGIDAFLSAQKGEKGDDGFETWKKIPGNAKKTIEDWAEAMRGKQGIQGDPRAPFTVAGSKETITQLPFPGDEKKAYYVGIDLYVWVEGIQDYFVVPGLKGMSAYEDWLASDPEHAGLSVDVFLNSLISQVPGPRGFKGEDGKDGRNLRVKGTVSNAGNLREILKPEDQDGYVASDTGRLWMWLPNDPEPGWVDLGPYRGVDGLDSYQVWKKNVNPEGTMGEYLASIKGKDGINMKVNGIVDTLNDLPINAQEQMLYAVIEEHSFYMYLDGAWANIGNYGMDGKDGIDGKSLDIIKVFTEADQVIPPADASTKGKAYVSLNPRDVYVNVSGYNWINAGPFMPEGKQGIQGVAFRPKGTVTSLQELPRIGGKDGAQEGDSYSVISEAKKMWTVIEGRWEGPIDIVGPQGDQGIQGIPGALMPIKGVYKSMPLLRAAKPTGSLGDAYMIIDLDAKPDPIRNLAIWSEEGNDWVDTGPAGVKGERGPAGPASTIPGPIGSQWLILDTQDAPSNVFNGREGDWAVNRLMRVYYRTATSWAYWGTLVAGDVNSPLQSEGKVVRYGDVWVPLPVDEVKNAEQGKFYGRTIVGQTESGGNVLDWSEIKTIEDLKTKDDVKQFVRVFKKDSSVPVWAELDGMQDPLNPKDGAYYLRFSKNKSWVEFKVAPSDDKLYMSKNGDWVAFDRYDVLMKKITTTYQIDPLVEQFVKLDNTAATAKTISLKAGPKDRGMVVVLVVVGITGGLLYDSTNIKWDLNTIPSLSGTRNVISFVWDGEFWLGAKGANPTT